MKFYPLLLLLLLACDRPECQNENPVFEQYPPTSKIYQDELARQLNLADGSQLRYWLQKYEARRGREYLHFYVQGNEFCATVILTANQWGKMEPVVQKKAASYRGAEFTRLTFDIRQEEAQTIFVYKDFGAIVD